MSEPAGPEEVTKDASPSTDAAAKPLTRAEATKRVSDHFDDQTMRIHASMETLRGDLKRTDEPAWCAEIASALLTVAFTSAVGASAEALVAEVFAAARHGGGHEVSVLGHFVKEMLSNGVDEGLAIGKSRLHGTRNEEAIDRLVDAHKNAAQTANIENRHRFDEHGSKRLSQTEVQAVAAGCGDTALRAAAQQHYDHARNAFLSYLAQQRLGANSDGTTDMRTQDRRDDANRAAPGWAKPNAPSPEDVLMGRLHGVLEVRAELPAIRFGHMDRHPTVTYAVLNGTNSTIRDQFAGVSLSQSRIPRQIIASVDDGTTFTLNIDESNNVTGLRHAESSWLRARAVVDTPLGYCNGEGSDLQGVALLLEDLKPTTVLGWT
jgi:hypothetical protein